MTASMRQARAEKPQQAQRDKIKPVMLCAHGSYKASLRLVLWT